MSDCANCQFKKQAEELMAKASRKRQIDRERIRKLRARFDRRSASNKIIACRGAV